MLKIEGDRTFNVQISKSVKDTWEKYRQYKRSDNEAFGILIGSLDLDSKTILVEKCTEPYEGDCSTRRSFTLKSKRHQEILDLEFDKSEGTRFYLGTWHTHPENTPTPSSIDIKDWKKCRKRNKGKPVFVFAIVGIVSQYYFVSSDETKPKKKIRWKK